jgi:hypothetical protein
VIKTITLLGVSRASFQDYVGVQESWEHNISEQEQRAETNSDIKRSSYIEKDCFEKSQSCCSTGDSRAELNIHLEDPVFTKTIGRDVSFTNPISTVGLQLLNL